MKLSAIVAGFATDIALTFLFTSLVIAIVGGDTPEDTSRRVTSSTELLISLSLVGLSFTAIGGYVAALLARERHIQHALGVGLLSLALGLGCSLAPQEGDAPEQPAWLQAAGIALTLPFAALGGWYRRVAERPPT